MFPITCESAANFTHFIFITTSALRLLALRGWRTLCSGAGGHLINYKGDNISKYVRPTVIIDFARGITKFVNFKNFRCVMITS